MAPDDVRVVAVIKSLGPGGAEQLLVEFAESTAPAGIDLQVWSLLDQKRQLIEALEAAGATVHCIGVRRLSQVRWLVRLIAGIRAHQPEVVHTHSPALAPFIRCAGRLGLLGRPRPVIVTTEHNVVTTYRAATRLFDRMTSRLDDATIAVSDEVRASIAPERARRRTRVIRHGINLAVVRSSLGERAAVRNAFGIAADEVVVVTVANFRAQKNYPNLLAAAAIAVRSVPGLRFLVVGQGPLAAMVEAEHRRLHLGDRMLLLGFRPDARNIIAAADIFSLASDYEGLPVALMEALALGLPVVATAVGGVAETVGPNAGRLVPPNDPAALAAALVEVAADTALRELLRSGALAASQQFDGRISAQQITALYEEQLARRRHRRGD